MASIEVFHEHFRSQLPTRLLGSGPQCSGFRLTCGVDHGYRLIIGGDISDPLVDSLSNELADHATIMFYKANKNSCLQFPSPWLSVPGFILPKRLRLDIMHIGDLGVTPRLIGTILRRALDAGCFGTDGQAWPRVVAEMQVWYRQLREHVPELGDSERYPPQPR